jgi:SPX domain protein involved in polyphosphate accumulation
MKFGKRLQSQIQETLPEWRDKFLSYKQLKKRLKLIAAPDCFTDAAFEASPSPPPLGNNNGDHQSRAASAVDAVDEELRRARSEAGGPAAVLQSTLLHDEQSSKRMKRPLVEQQQQASLQTIQTNCCGKYDVEFPGRGGGVSGLWSSPENEFVRLLNNELRKFNMFFIEKEEEYVIRLQELKDRIERVKRQRGTNYDDPLQSVGDDKVLRVFRDIVTFHGEMVLLENYSSLNYTGVPEHSKH